MWIYFCESVHVPCNGPVYAESGLRAANENTLWAGLRSCFQPGVASLTYPPSSIHN